METVIPPPPVPSVAVRGLSAVFPIHRIYCVGRNYAAHAREMGHDPDREPPFFFQKNPDSVVANGGNFPYPARSRNVQHEIELVVALGRGGSGLRDTESLDWVYGYAVGLDMTRRDLQGRMKKMGRPWEIGKAFERAAPCSDIVPADRIGHPHTGAIWLKVNGEVRQQGDLDQMIWRVPEIIAHLSEMFTLAPGDLIYTGTPAGVAEVQRGDLLEGGIDGIGVLCITVV